MVKGTHNVHIRETTKKTERSSIATWSFRLHLIARATPPTMLRTTIMMADVRDNGNIPMFAVTDSSSSRSRGRRCQEAVGSVSCCKKTGSQRIENGSVSAAASNSKRRPVQRFMVQTTHIHCPNKTNANQ